MKVGKLQASHNWCKMMKLHLETKNILTSDDSVAGDSSHMSSL